MLDLASLLQLQSAVLPAGKRLRLLNLRLFQVERRYGVHGFMKAIQVSITRPVHPAELIQEKSGPAVCLILLAAAHNRIISIRFTPPIPHEAVYQILIRRHRIRLRLLHHPVRTALLRLGHVLTSQLGHFAVEN